MNTQEVINQALPISLSDNIFIKENINNSKHGEINININIKEEFKNIVEFKNSYESLTKEVKDTKDNFLSITFFTSSILNFFLTFPLFNNGLIFKNLLIKDNVKDMIDIWFFSALLSFVISLVFGLSITKFLNFKILKKFPLTKKIHSLQKKLEDTELNFDNNLSTKLEDKIFQAKLMEHLNYLEKNIDFKQKQYLKDLKSNIVIYIQNNDFQGLTNYLYLHSKKISSQEDNINFTLDKEKEVYSYLKQLEKDTNIILTDNTNNDNKYNKIIADYRAQV